MTSTIRDNAAPLKSVQLVRGEDLDDAIPERRIGKVVLHACERRLTVSVRLDAAGKNICQLFIRC